MALLLDSLLTLSITIIALLGLFITYELLKIINLAHGEMIAVGAYSASLASQHGLGLIGGCLGGTTAGALAGLLIEWTVVRRFYGRNAGLSLLGTWALSLAIVQLLRLLFGASGQFVPTPVHGSMDVFGEKYPIYRILILVFSAVTLVGFLIAHRSRAGVSVRAAMENPKRAEAFGIDTRRSFQATFVLGTAVAGLSGSLIAPMVAVTPDMGTDYTTLGFLALLLARSGTLTDGLAACALLSVGQSLLAHFIDVNSATLLTDGAALATLIYISVMPPWMRDSNNIATWKG